MKSKSLSIDNVGTSATLMQKWSLFRNLTIGGITLLTTSIGSCPSGLAATLYEADASGAINTISETGVVTPFVTGLHPTAIAFNPSGDLYEADSTGVINSISSTGVVTPFVTGLNKPTAMTFSTSGNLYVVNSGSGILNRITPDGTSSLLAYNFLNPTALAINATGLYSADAGDNTIYKSPVVGGFFTGTIEAFVTGLNNPTAMVFSETGNLYVANSGSGILNRITPDKTSSLIAYNILNPTALADNASGLYLAEAGDNNKIYKFPVVNGFFTNTIEAFATGVTPTALAFGPDLPASTAVPEPFTVIGTIVGGTAALRMRKKLKSAK